MPFKAADEAVRMIEPPSFISGRAFCTVKSVPLTLPSNVLSKCSSVIAPSGAKVPPPALATRMSMCPFSFFYLSIQTIEIGQIGDVALNAGDIAGDFPDGLFQFILAAACNENIGAFRDKPLAR